MILPSKRISLSTSKAASLVALAVGIGFPVVSRAEVKPVVLEDLAARSHLIVIAKVSTVEDAPANLGRDDPGMPPLKVATAQVIETWKGTPVREVRYVASPDSMCDTSHAVKGERVVLFLTHSRWRKDSAFLSITHAGHGRMPIREVEAKMYAAVSDEVILPQGTPTISEQKTVQIPVPATESGKPATAITHTYSVTSIELSVLRGLVRRAAPEK